MPLDDYLMPAEQIKFQSSESVRYGEKPYRVIVTDRRLILYARRGRLFKEDDVISQKLDELEALKFSEQGVLVRKGLLRIQTAKTEMRLLGPLPQIKALYQQMMQFL
jgi:hypothetical protein